MILASLSVPALLGIVAAFFALAGVVSAVRAIMTARTSQGAIAWATVLLTWPTLAVPVYWALGRNRFNGRVRYRRGQDAKLDSIVGQAQQATQPFRTDIDERYANARVLNQLTQLPFFSGNDTELLIDGPAIFDAITAGIDRAEKYVLAEFYIVRDDKLGRRFHAALVRAAKRGCEVYLLYDDVGSQALTKAYREELRQAGVRVSGMNTRKGPGNRFQINFRNHRKIVIIDGKEVFIGGANVGDDYLHEDKRLTPWRDTHMRIVGPASLAAQLTFIEDWHWANDSVPEIPWHTEAAANGSDKPVFILPSGPDDRYETCGLFFTHCINSAQKRLWISSPYFVPNEGVIAALQLAAMRGVDVRIMIPGVADQWLVKRAAMSFVPEVAEAGVQMYEYEAGFTHQKVMLIDDFVSVVGTANFDNRSFRLNFEVSAVTIDRHFASQIASMLETDLGNSRRIEVAEIQSRSFWFRFSSRVARLFAPVL